jgi:siroheme synthase (precorrin-2 oxidase/ferrochelatase)
VSHNVDELVALSIGGGEIAARRVDAVLQLLQQLTHGARERRALDGTRDSHLQHVAIERFGEVVVRASPHRVDR